VSRGPGDRSRGQRRRGNRTSLEVIETTLDAAERLLYGCESLADRGAHESPCVLLGRGLLRRPWSASRDRDDGRDRRPRGRGCRCGGHGRLKRGRRRRIRGKGRWRNGDRPHRCRHGKGRRTCRGGGRCGRRRRRWFGHRPPGRGLDHRGHGNGRGGGVEGRCDGIRGRSSHRSYWCSRCGRTCNSSRRRGHRGIGNCSPCRQGSHGKVGRRRLTGRPGRNRRGVHRDLRRCWSDGLRWCDGRGRQGLYREGLGWGRGRGAGRSSLRNGSRRRLGGRPRSPCTGLGHISTVHQRALARKPYGSDASTLSPCVLACKWGATFLKRSTTT
jgi:hypothetical protein